MDTTARQLTIDAVPATTTDLQITITGTVSNDTVAIHIGSMDNAASIQNGKFTATINLQPNEENHIRIFAVDQAGNTAEQIVKVTHIAGKPKEPREHDSNSGFNPSPNPSPNPNPDPIPPSIIPSRIETSNALVNVIIRQPEIITFTVYDQNGKRFNGAKVNFNVTGSLKQQGLSGLTAQTSSDGTVIVTFTGDEIGNSGAITASVAGTNVQVQTGTINIVGEPALIIVSPESGEITKLLPGQSMTATFIVM